ncbi:MAG TPA: hypothetical protein VMZ26_04620 [Pyrinomonadaceae bacterium]|nr:hypothetical protein [Pyrinomonadaceae bacterium]
MITNLKYLFAVLTVFMVAAFSAAAQNKDERKSGPITNPVLWEEVQPGSLDLFNGPGGAEMQPDVSRVTFIKEETQGHNKKFRIKDAKGQVWVAKLGREAQPETAAVRLLYGLGYKTEINYLVPTLNIPGKGTFKNVRLEARPDNVERLDEWKWKDNPFVGSNELQGLKIMMVFLTNWDLLDLQNKVVRVNDNGSVEHHFIVSDLGATFGKLGNNNLPFFFRLGRKTNDPGTWYESGFVSGVKNGRIDFDFKGKGRGLMEDITVAQGRWLTERLGQLTDKQIDDAFRAAGYSADEVELLRQGVRERTAELDKATRGSVAAN